jgi:uncharacterized membrane protein
MKTMTGFPTKILGIWMWMTRVNVSKRLRGWMTGSTMLLTMCSRPCSCCPNNV